MFKHSDDSEDTMTAKDEKLVAFGHGAVPPYLMAHW
jgi:hypothetical protein